MSENWKIQVSPKLTDGTLINLRAETPDEAARILDWSIENAGKIGEAVKALNAVEVFTQAFPGAQVTVQAPPNQQPPQQQGGGWNPNAQTPPPPWVGQQPQAQQAPPQQAPNDEGLLPPQFCSHGAMQLRRAAADSGKSWVAYMCPTKKGTPGQCRPIDAKTGKSWN